MKKTRLAATIGGAITGAGLLATQFVGGWEGVRLVAYQDVVGVWTACYGETKGIRPGMKFTKSQCDAMFIGSLTEHEQGMRACLNRPDAIPEKTYVAFVSFTYNVGVGAFCGSTLRRNVNAGDLRAACEQLPRWNKAGGRVVKGLTNRRAAERALCIDGLDEPVAALPPAMIAEPEPEPAQVVEQSTVPSAWIVAGILGALGIAAGLFLISRRKP